MVHGLKSVLGLRGHRFLGKNKTRTVKNMSKELRDPLLISHVLNDKETGYECLKLIGVKSDSHHMKEHPRITQIVKFERD